MDTHFFVAIWQNKLYTEIKSSLSKIYFAARKVTILETTVIYENAKILIVDDQETNIQLLERILKRAGYSQIHSTDSPRLAIPIFHEVQPDIILLDLHMPDMDGRQLLQLLTPLIPKTMFLPIVILTADVTPKSKREALLLGANDFLTKPLDSVEVLLRMRNLLQTRFLNLAVQQYNQQLEERVKQRTMELELAQSAIIECLAKASEYRDDSTGEHAYRVGEMAKKLASALGYSIEQAEMIRLAASLHDLGKIGIPDNILLKPSSLTAEEFEIMQTHTTIGNEILPKAPFPLLEFARNIALSHHERWDGTGYPHGLAGDGIPLEAQIVSIVDVYDALTHRRPYKSSWTSERAMAEIANQRNKQFNPKVVDTFFQILEREKVYSVR
jgi:putative two-component system response regulator